MCSSHSVHKMHNSIGKPLHCPQPVRLSVPIKPSMNSPPKCPQDSTAQDNIQETTWQHFLRTSCACDTLNYLSLPGMASELPVNVKFPVRRTCLGMGKKCFGGWAWSDFQFNFAPGLWLCQLIVRGYPPKITRYPNSWAMVLKNGGGLVAHISIADIFFRNVLTEFLGEILDNCLQRHLQ